MTNRNHKVAFFAVVILAMLACVPALPASNPAPIPTFDPNSINTLIAQTAEAAMTQTALLAPPTHTPTPTLIPTQTPSNTPEPTATFIFILNTPTATKNPISGSGALACELTAQSPVDNTVYPPGKDFEVKWTVTNIGTELWDARNMDFIYLSGAKIHKTGALDLPKSVPSGTSIDLTVRMKSPSDSGKYTTAWTLQTGKKQFCKLTLAIEVK